MAGGGGSVKHLREALDLAGFQVIEEKIESNWNPEESDFEGLEALVKDLL